MAALDLDVSLDHGSEFDSWSDVINVLRDILRDVVS